MRRKKDVSYLEKQRNVCELGWFQVKSLIENDVFGCGGDPFLPTNDMRDLHCVVIDYVRKMVGREPIGLHENLVFHLSVIDRDLPMDDIVERSLAFWHA